MKNILFLAGLLLMISCNSSKKMKSSNELYLTGTRWTVIKVRESMASSSRNPRTIELALPNKKGNGTFSGNTGCNTMTGSYSSEKGTSKIRFSEIATTKMLCQDDKQESIILDALNSVNSYELSGSILKLYSGGDLLLTLEGVNITQ